MRLIRACAVVLLAVILSNVQGRHASRKAHHIKKKGTLPEPYKNSVRSALEGIHPEELQQPATQISQDSKGTKKDVFGPSLQASNKLMSSQLSAKESGIMSDFLKDMDKNHGVLTPNLMKQMARLEEAGPGQQDESQGFARNLGPRGFSFQSPLQSFTPDLVGVPKTGYPRDLDQDIRPYTDTVLPFKLDDNQNIVKKGNRYYNDPMPEYSVKETTYTPATGYTGDTDGYQQRSSDYNYDGDNRGDNFDQQIRDNEQQDRNGELKKAELQNAASLLEKKQDEDHLIKEIGTKVLMNMLNQKATTSAEIGGSKTQLTANVEGVGQEEEAESSSRENVRASSSSLPSSLDAKVALPPDAVQRYLQQGVLNRDKQSNLGTASNGVSQEPLILLAPKLNANIQERLEGPESSKAPAIDVSGKHNKNIQAGLEFQQVTEPTAKVYEVVNKTPTEKYRIVIPELADAGAVKPREQTEKRKDSKDETKGQDDMVTLKISGAGKPVSFNADASADGSIYLKIPKKFSEQFVKSEDSEKETGKGELKQAKKQSKSSSKKEEDEESDEEDGDVRHLGGKLTSGHLPNKGSWVIEGKTAQVTDIAPTQDTTTRPTIRPSKSQVNPQAKASLAQTPEAVAKNIASLTQALWAGQLARLSHAGQNQAGESTAQSILPFVASAENLNLDKMMSLLAHPEELPSTQVGATAYDGTSPTTFGVRGKVGYPVPLKSILKASKLMEGTGVARNKGMSEKSTAVKQQTDNGWSPCTASCGHGIQARARTCIKGHDCSGFQTESRQCYLSPCPEELAKAGLRMHNKFRLWHHSPPLQWSDILAKKAQKLAASLAESKNNDASSMDELPGENIAAIDNDYDVAAEKATTKWYEEVQGFRFQNPSLADATKHFSQVVWKGTKTVGIGVAKSSTGKTYVVALYDPPGNVEGKEKENINTPNDAPS